MPFNLGSGFAVDQKVAPNHFKVAVPFFEVTHFFFSTSKFKRTCVRIYRNLFFYYHRNWFAIVLTFDVPNNHLRGHDGSASAVAVLLLIWKLHKLVAPVKEFTYISSIVFC